MPRGRPGFPLRSNPGYGSLLGRLALTGHDGASSRNEERWFTLGLDAGGRLLAVAHTYEIAGPTNARIRIISAREATRRERRSYEDEP